MDAGRFPSFAAMYSGYFHEDWRLDDQSAADVIRQYRRSAPQEELDRLGEMRGLHALHPFEEALRDELGPFTHYDPAEDGLSVQVWTEDLIEVVDSPTE